MLTPLSTNSPISSPSPALNIVAVHPRGRLVRHRCGIAPALEVYVFEVECVEVAWDDAVEDGSISGLFAGGGLGYWVRVRIREGRGWGVGVEEGERHSP